MELVHAQHVFAISPCEKNTHPSEYLHSPLKTVQKECPAVVKCHHGTKAIRGDDATPQHCCYLPVRIGCQLKPNCVQFGGNAEGFFLRELLLELARNCSAERRGLLFVSWRFSKNQGKLGKFAEN
jgi:hypothetical protein